MAITERYVNNAGSGAADGTSEANAMSFATFTDYMVTGGSFTAAAGDRFNLKVDGTYARTTTTDTWVNGGSATSPVIVRGYNSAIGDGNLGRTNGNGALITTNMPVITYTTGRISITGAFIFVESLNVSGAPSNALVTPFSDCVVKSCKVVNSSTNASAVAISSGARSITFDCDAELSGASGASCAVNAAGAGCRILNNRIKGGPGIGMLCSGGAAVIGNVIFAQTGIGISMNSTSGAPLIYGNTVVGGAGDAINVITATTGLQCIIRNMITDNTGDGIDMVSTANAAFAAYNRTRDNANGYNNAGDWITATQYGDVTTDTGSASSDYVNSGSNDYSIIQTSPARAAGWFKYSTIGALQPQSWETSSTSGS